MIQERGTPFCNLLISTPSNNNAQSKNPFFEIVLNETLVFLGEKKRFHLLEEILILSGQLPIQKTTCS